MADPLSEVYTGRDNTGSAAVFGKTPDMLGAYLKQQQLEELARIKAQPKPEQFDKSIDADLAGLGKAHPNDIPALTEQYTKVLGLKKQWLAEKDPMKRAAIVPQYIAEKAKLASGVANSNRTIAQLQKADQYQVNDKKHTLPSDFEDRKKAYLDTPVWERPESFDYGVVNTMSAADNAFKRALGNMPKSNYMTVEITPDGKQITKARKGISEADARKQFTADWYTAMPQNEKNMWRDITLEAASPSDGSAPDPHAVELIQKYGINDAAREFAIDMNMVNAHNKLGEGLYKVQPSPKSATGGAGKEEAMMPEWEVTKMGKTKFGNNAVVVSFATKESKQPRRWDNEITIDNQGNRTVALGTDKNPVPVTGYFNRIIHVPGQSTPVVEIIKRNHNTEELHYVNLTAHNNKILEQIGGQQYYDALEKAGYDKYARPKKAAATKTKTNYSTLKF